MSSNTGHQASVIRHKASINGFYYLQKKTVLKEKPDKKGGKPENKDNVEDDNDPFKKHKIIVNRKFNRSYRSFICNLFFPRFHDMKFGSC